MKKRIKIEDISKPSARERTAYISKAVFPFSTIFSNPYQVPFQFQVTPGPPRPATAPPTPPTKIWLKEPSAPWSSLLVPASKEPSWPGKPGLAN